MACDPCQVPRTGTGTWASPDSNRRVVDRIAPVIHRRLQLRMLKHVLATYIDADRLPLSRDPVVGFDSRSFRTNGFGECPGLGCLFAMLGCMPAADLRAVEQGMGRSSQRKGLDTAATGAMGSQYIDHSFQMKTPDGAETVAQGIDCWFETKRRETGGHSSAEAHSSETDGPGSAGRAERSSMNKGMAGCSSITKGTVLEQAEAGAEPEPEP